MSETMTEAAIDPDWAWASFEPTAEYPWDADRASHLFRRGGFAADHETLNEATRRPVAAVIDQLFARSEEAASFQKITDQLAQTVSAGGKTSQLSAAWIYRMISSPQPLLEKMTLFWHGHFATSIEKVDDAAAMWQQNKLLREHALGSFRALVHGIAKDPAMLVYLDSTSNRKAHPNENFARELMELFCCGEGNYREEDVQQLARCFTGWEVRNGSFRKNRYQQDVGEKTLFGSVTLREGEEAIDAVLDRPDVANFIVAKLYGYLIDETAPPPVRLIESLADQFRRDDLQIAPLVRRMLGSNFFFSGHAMRRKIKSPVDYVIGMLRALNATANTEMLAGALRGVGQGVFYPPNVAGWEGGRSWINSATLLGRSNLVARILQDDATKFAGGSLTEYLERHGVGDAEQAVGFLERVLLASPIPAGARERLLSESRSEGRDRPRQYRFLVHSIMTLPQSHLQ